MIPSAVTSLAKAGAKLTKTQLTALSDKVYKMLKSGKTAAAFTKAEIAALKAMQNVAFQTEITKAFVKDLVKKLANKTNATKFVKQLKAASQSVQKKLISTVTRFADDVDGKMFTDILIQNGFMSAGASAIRLANAVTDAEMKSMQQEVLKNLNNYFTKQAEKIQGPFKGAAWLESRNRDMMLTSLLEQDIEAEPIRPTILPKDTAATSMDTIDTSVTEPATIKTVKPASKPKTAKKSTTGNKTYSDNTADYEAENVKGLGDGEWSISDILYWSAIGWGAFKIGGLAFGAIQGANGLALWLNGKGTKQGYLGFDKLRSLDVYQAYRMISDRKALKNEGIILTRKEYRAITKDIQRNSEREIDYVLSQIRNNKKFIPKSASQSDINAAASEAYKQLYRLTPGSTKLRDYAERIVKAVEQQTRKSASRTSTASKQSSIEKVRSAIAKSSVTPGSTTAASINLPTGAPAGTVLTVNQRVALQNDPSTPWSKLKNL
jgi:DNA-binding transcriptional regulator GbsR (MarR family)